ncbi:MAG: hypothetical protein UR53_C0001G0031 [Candidatus Magasanikbacteria bacterium GW2011_GWC2_34_16]|uniref:Uncharacterized protein n=2 Tax=Candidatus Magasanikiibacteriota TaxID=1752731 RepID=A0A0G0KK51_9BACT|nr:MAG: hypothetical protein UR53_C0001G0031 [Candidatus Magasanikbacteria bacterium GW2011_GWC2_34_16]KKQ40981.1 MAG: hypothetical protein US58_C0008G0010 [Candidatus Magasanikbacteria bacterium GW2011_GWA2_37_8]
MFKKILPYIIIAIMIVLGVLLVFLPRESASNSLVLYYGDTCPHCKVVEQYIVDNKIDEKIVFTKKEVYRDEKNAAELGKRAVSCGLDTSSIGVPFLWDGTKCYTGQDDVINYFAARIK